jgi:hypothetical protein
MMEYFDLEAIWNIYLQIEHIFTYTKKEIIICNTAQYYLRNFHWVHIMAYHTFLPKYFMFTPLLLQYDIL